MLNKKPRYIDASPLEVWLENKVKAWTGKMIASAYLTALNRLKDAPTVELAPVKNDCEDCRDAAHCKYNRSHMGVVRVNCPVWRAGKQGGPENGKQTEL